MSGLLKQPSKREQRIAEKVEDLTMWIEILKERARLLMSFEISKLTEDQRENAANRALVLVGRFYEIVHNLESELLGGEGEDDDPRYVDAIIAGERDN